MYGDSTQNHWWRHVPKSVAGGWGYVFVWAFVMVISIVDLALHLYSGPVANIIQGVILVLAVWNLLRSATGLALLRRR
jgi:hypothetical protein